MLQEQLLEINKKLDHLTTFISSLPEWLPLTGELASQYGYSPNGFRKHIINNVPPHFLKVEGRQYYIHIQALSLLKKKSKN